MEVSQRHRIKSNIDSHGCHVIKVMEEGSLPGFGYSIGLFERYKHSELLFVGLGLDLIHQLINSLAEDIAKGRVLSDGQFVPDIIGSFNCYITNVQKENYDEYIGQAIDYYGTDSFPLIQCIYPTNKGFYPWERGWPEDIQWLQPVLGKQS